MLQGDEAGDVDDGDADDQGSEDGEAAGARDDKLSSAVAGE
jgi:hypothetical protein